MKTARCWSILSIFCKNNLKYADIFENKKTVIFKVLADFSYINPQVLLKKLQVQPMLAKKSNYFGRARSYLEYIDLFTES
jgi:hypothetical protein